MKRGMKHGMLGAALAAVALLVCAPAASAQYDEVESLTLEGSTCNPGGPLTATVSGAEPGSEVTFIFESDPIVLGTVVVDADGNATLETVWPESASEGGHLVRATGTAGDGGELEVVAEIQCSALEAAGAADALPRTGSDTGTWVRLAIVLVTVGAVMVLVARRGARQPVTTST